MKFDPIIGFPRWQDGNIEFKEWHHDNRIPRRFVGFPIEFITSDIMYLLDYSIQEQSPDRYRIFKFIPGKGIKEFGIEKTVFDAMRKVHDLSDHDLMVESNQFDDIFGQIVELANDGMSWDGNHHKLWFFKQIRDLIPEFGDDEAIAP